MRPQKYEFLVNKPVFSRLSSFFYAGEWGFLLFSRGRGCGVTGFGWLAEKSAWGVNPVYVRSKSKCPGCKFEGGGTGFSRSRVRCFRSRAAAVADGACRGVSPRACACAPCARAYIKRGASPRGWIWSRGDAPCCFILSRRAFPAWRGVWPCFPSGNRHMLSFVIPGGLSVPRGRPAGGR